MAGALSLGGFLVRGESHGKDRGWRRADFQGSSKLPGEVGHQLQAEGSAPPRLEIAGQAGARVAYEQMNPARRDP